VCTARSGWSHQRSSKTTFTGRIRCPWTLKRWFRVSEEPGTEHVTPQMQRYVLTVLQERWLRSELTLLRNEADRLFSLEPMLEEHYRENSESGLPKEPASKMISRISPTVG